MSWENALLMEFSNDVEEYEIEVTKWVKTAHFFTVICIVFYALMHTVFFALMHMVFQTWMYT